MPPSLSSVGRWQNFSFQTGSEHLLARQRVKRITTGCKALDALLGGGIESNSLTEIYGEFRTGKSQWVHTMCVTGMVLPSRVSTTLPLVSALPRPSHEKLRLTAPPQCTLCSSRLLVFVLCAALQGRRGGARQGLHHRHGGCLPFR